jgi:hypothetical protein
LHYDQATLVLFRYADPPPGDCAHRHTGRGCIGVELLSLVIALRSANALYPFNTTQRDGAPIKGVDFGLADKLSDRAHAQRLGLTAEFPALTPKSCKRI